MPVPWVEETSAGWMARQQFCGGESGAEEGVNCGDEVPYCDAVEPFDHGAGDAPFRGVEVGGHLSADNAAERGFAWYACGGAAFVWTSHSPFRWGRGGGVRVGFHIVVGFGLGGDNEGDVAVEVDGCHVDGAFTDEGVVVDEAADACAGDNFVAEAIVDVFFGDGVAIGVVPAGGWGRRSS